MAWTAKKSGQQLQKHVLPRVAFGCSTVWEVLGSKSGGLGARKEKFKCIQTDQWMYQPEAKSVIIPIVQGSCF